MHGLVQICIQVSFASERLKVFGKVSKQGKFHDLHSWRLVICKYSASCTIYTWREPVNHLQPTLVSFFSNVQRSEGHLAWQTSLLLIHSLVCTISRRSLRWRETRCVMICSQILLAVLWYMFHWNSPLAARRHSLKITYSQSVPWKVPFNRL